MWPQCGCLSFPFLAVAGVVAQAALLQEGQGGGLAKAKLTMSLPAQSCLELLDVL